MDPLTLLPTLPSLSTPGPSRVSFGQQLIFDFTKRKRWADLLVSELTEAIMFALSSTGQVWFCSPAVEELLGWKDEEIVDGDLSEIMNEDDRATFQRQFTDSIRTRTDLLSYVRLQCKTDNDLYPSIPVPVQSNSGSNVTEFTQIPTRRPAPREVLFEIKGYAHFVESSDSDPGAGNGSFNGLDTSGGSGTTVDVGTGEVFKCFFAMARPYPSRNTAMLNTFLELKIENERLQQRRDAALARVEAQNQAKQTQARPTSSHYRASSYPYSFTDQAASSGSGYDGSLMYPVYEDMNAGTSGSSKSKSKATQDEPDEHNMPRKKSKRTLGPEQHVCVTCGRTDSPEWRKGPLGPKTLCNACGLRWAKTVRRDPSLAAATDASTDQAETTNNHMAGPSGHDMRTLSSGGFNY